MRLKVSFVAMAVMALASVSFAQQGGGGGGQGRRGGMMGMMQMGGGARLTQLLRSPQVQTELKITDEQKAKIAELPGGRGGGGQRGGGGGNGGGGNGGGGGQRRGGQPMSAEEQMKQLTEDKAATSAILTPEQEKRLEELRIQWAGARAATYADVQTALALTDAQKASITELTTKQGEANRTLMEKVRNQEMDMQDAMTQRTKNDDILKAEIDKVLTADQKTKLKTMGGAELKMEMPARRVGGNGR